MKGKNKFDRIRRKRWENVHVGGKKNGHDAFGFFLRKEKKHFHILSKTFRKLVSKKYFVILKHSHEYLRILNAKNAAYRIINNLQKSVEQSGRLQPFWWVQLMALSQPFKCQQGSIRGGQEELPKGRHIPHRLLGYELRVQDLQFIMDELEDDDVAVVNFLLHIHGASVDGNATIPLQAQNKKRPKKPRTLS